MVPEDMIKLAEKFIKNAYAPYSGFRVASVVRTSSGKLYVGVNVENSSYGLTVCAERVAIFNAITHGEREISEVLVYTIDSDTPVFPCGACLQVMAEFRPSDKDITIYAYSARTGLYKKAHLQELLPKAFRMRSHKHHIPI